MSDNPLNDSAKPRPDSDGDKPGGTSLKGSNTKLTVGKRIIWGAFGALFVGAGFSIHGWSSLAISLAGIVCGSIVLKIEAQNRPRHRILRNASWVFFVVGVGLLGLKYLDENKSVTKSHFKVGILGSILPGGSLSTIELTNKQMIFGENDYLSPNKMTALITVPVAGIYSNATMRLLAINDSQMEDEGITITVLLFKKIIWSQAAPIQGEQRWMNLESAPPDFKAVAIRSEKVLLPSDTAICPTLNLTKEGGWDSKAVPMIIQLRAKGMAPEFILFLLRGEVDTNATQWNLRVNDVGNSD